MKTKVIKPNPKLIHFFIGSPGCMTIHTKEHVFESDKLKIGGLNIKVESVVEQSKSKSYPGLLFYELKFSML